MSRAVLVLFAMLLNAALGGPASWYEALGLGRLQRRPAIFIRELERKLNREHRSPADRRFRGIALVLMAAGASIVGGLLLGWTFKHLFWIGEPLMLALALPIRPSWDVSAEIRKKLQVHDVAAAKQALSHTAWRHYALLDDYGVARAGIELLAVHFSEKIVAPIFWYLLLGLPGLFISKAIYLLHETLNPQNTAEEFGSTAKRAHYWLHYLPARLATVLWIAVTFFLPAGAPKKLADQLAPHIAKTGPQELALWSAAGALKLSLGGPSSIYTAQWVGSGTPKPVASNVRQALYAFALLGLFLFILVGFFF